MKERSWILILGLCSSVYLVAFAVWEKTAQPNDGNILIGELKTHYSSISLGEEKKTSELFQERVWKRQSVEPRSNRHNEEYYSEPEDMDSMIRVSSMMGNPEKTVHETWSGE